MTGPSATGAAFDLDDVEAVLAADTDGVLRAASAAGAQVRATAAAVAEGALADLRRDYPPRAVLWVAGRGPAATAGALLAAALGGAIAEPLVVLAEVPPWIGALDVLVVAGDDPGDPTLAAAAATGIRRGAQVVVAAPYEGPLRDATAGRAAVVEPRLGVPAAFGLSRYLAVGLAVLTALGLLPPGGTDLTGLADDLDAEVLRNSAAREVFTNPAKALAARIAGGSAVLAGDCAATLTLARHGAGVLLAVGRTPVAAAGLGEALAALRDQRTGAAADLFHDEQFDGPAPRRLRVLALALAAERTVVAARTAGTDAELVDAGDVPVAPGGTAGPPAPGAVEQQLALLAVRLEMAAAYLRLMRG